MATLQGRQVYVKSKTGLYLARGSSDYTYVWGTVVTESATNSGLPSSDAVWLMRWPFDAGNTKGPQQDTSRWPSSETTSTNFHLVHPDGSVALHWPSPQSQIYLGPYYIENGEDASANDGFNCRRDVLANDPAGYSYFALNNSDRSLVADIGTIVSAWPWNGGDNQQWQFIAVGGAPI